MRRHLKLCHTSDWHLGHTLHGHPREHEHERFLAFLLDVLEREAVDALIVAGDVFDTANPPASAQAMFYRFLAEARARLPRLDVVIVAGNHDSAARLGAADPVLRAIGVRIVGAVPRLGAGGRAPVDADAMVVPLHDRNNEVAAWVAAVPYLRPADLPALDAPVNAERADPLVEGVRRVYGEVLDAARARQKPDQALIATGHCHMVDVQRSEDSERPILGGLKHALPVDLFPGDVGYAALGHIHLAQPVGEHEHVRYCGSPIPLSMPEESYPHEVRLVRFEGGVLVGQTKVRVPRAVDVIRVPGEEADSHERVLGQLERLEVPAGLPREQQPFLEVRVRLSEPVPDLRRQIEAAIGERPVRLVKITTAYTGRDVPLAESAPRRDLGDLQVEEVFRQAYARRYEGDPSPALLRAFHEVAASAARALEEGEA
ncbi:MAG TPA: exonuclease sbcCD subunit D [Myxococcales bacterium]|nr:exonuclease sbcCD subunit D [Myxococcales bacterium]